MPDYGWRLAIAGFFTVGGAGLMLYTFAQPAAWWIFLPTGTVMILSALPLWKNGIGLWKDTEAARAMVRASGGK